MPDLGKVIKALRERANISRQTLARAAKVDPAILFRLEEGERNALQFATLCRVADALDISLDELAAAAGFRRAAKGRGLPPDNAALLALQEALGEAACSLQAAIDVAATITQTVGDENKPRSARPRTKSGRARKNR